jgi:riboflavin kinase/FMN adenylyltransferase
MQHVTVLEDLRLAQPASLTIGAFDGVHRGHRALISSLVAEAHAAGRAAVVLTFFPHPSVFLRGRRPSFYLSTPEEKAEYLAQLGIDAVVTHPFNAEVAAIRAADFVQRLVREARMQELWCGPDFALGHNREGTVEFLQAEGQTGRFCGAGDAAGADRRRADFKYPHPPDPARRRGGAGGAIPWPAVSGSRAR